MLRLSSHPGETRSSRETDPNWMSTLVCDSYWHEGRPPSCLGMLEITVPRG